MEQNKVKDNKVANESIQKAFEEEKATVKENSGDDYREFKYGHLIFECSRCSHRETIEKDVKDGISIFLPTTNKHEWVIVCPRCKNKMRFFYMESFKKDPEPVEPIEAKS